MLVTGVRCRLTSSLRVGSTCQCSLQKLSYSSQVERDRDDPNKSQVLDLLNKHFKDWKVGEKKGSIYNGYIGQTLEDSGYHVYPLFYSRDQSVKNYNTKTSEIDGLISGDNCSWSKLKILCYSHHDRSNNVTAVPHILAVEVMRSHEDLIKKGWPLSVSPGMTPCPNTHSVVFINGGPESKEWVLNGHSSPIDSHKTAWNQLKEANISVFYRESFHFEWVSWATKRLDQFDDVKAQLAELPAMKAQIDEIPAMIAQVKEFQKQLNDLSISMKAASTDAKDKEADDKGV